MTEPLYDIEGFKKHCLALVDMVPHAVNARHLTGNIAADFTKALLLAIGAVTTNSEAASRGYDPIFK